MTPEDFKRIDLEVCHLINIYDQITLKVEPIVCASCGEAGDCSCLGGNIWWHKASSGKRYYRRRK